MNCEDASAVTVFDKASSITPQVNPSSYKHSSKLDKSKYI